MKIKMLKTENTNHFYFGRSRRCRFCGSSSSNWPDSGECPVCGETN